MYSYIRIYVYSDGRNYVIVQPSQPNTVCLSLRIFWELPRFFGPHLCRCRPTAGNSHFGWGKIRILEGRVWHMCMPILSNNLILWEVNSPLTLFVLVYTYLQILSYTVGFLGPAALCGGPDQQQPSGVPGHRLPGSHPHHSRAGGRWSGNRSGRRRPVRDGIRNVPIHVGGLFCIPVRSAATNIFIKARHTTDQWRSEGGGGAAAPQFRRLLGRKVLW